MKEESKACRFIKLFLGTGGMSIFAYCVLWYLFDGRINIISYQSGVVAVSFAILIVILHKVVSKYDNKC